jgi:hypothetical protein
MPEFICKQGLYLRGEFFSLQIVTGGIFQTPCALNATQSKSKTFNSGEMIWEKF